MSARSASPLGRAAIWLVPALVLALVCYVRLRLLAVPLERDEGEFAYIGQLLLKGVPPFTQAYTMKLPGTAALYALFIGLFGASPQGVHLGLLLLHAVSVLLLYLLARRLFDPESAAGCAASYALLALSRAVCGVHAHATHFVVLFALAGLLLLLKGSEQRRQSLMLGAGLCLGLAVTMKQHAALLLLFALCYLAWRSWSRTEQRRFLLPALPVLLAGALTPYLLILAQALHSGSLASFWFWTVQYPRSYVSGQTLSAGVGHFGHIFSGLLLLQFPFWLLAGAGVALLAARRVPCSDRGFLAGFALFSFLAICPGLYFREHYFVMLLPAAALLAGAAASYAGRLAGALSPGAARWLPALLLLCASGYCLYLDRAYLFQLTPLQASRFTYDENPFPESLQVARYLKEHTSPTDRIAVLGSEPQIYFYADRLSATGHIYMYGLMEQQPYAEKMQRQMIAEIEQNRPKYVVLVNVKKSWLPGLAPESLVMRWHQRYLQQGYELVGVTDIVGSEITRYLWEREAAGYTPVSSAFLTIFKRRDGA